MVSAVIRSLKAVPRQEIGSATASGTSKVRARAWLKFVGREPLFQFLVLGLLIWGGVEYWHGHENRYTIHVGLTERQRIAMTYLQQFGQSPTPDQLQRLIDRYIREEIFLREGLALNLEKNDEIVRRRIAQKYEFLQTDLAVADSPDADVLKRWFEENRTRYLTPERVAFSQVYFSTDKDGEQAPRDRAAKVLDRLRASRAAHAPGLGDSFPGPSDVGALAPEEAVRLFGQSELSEKLFKLRVGQWSGPYRSGYGWHLVHVTGHSPTVLAPLAEVQERVLADYLEEQRLLLNARAFEKLRTRYSIRYDGERR